MNKKLILMGLSAVLVLIASCKQQEKHEPTGKSSDSQNQNNMHKQHENLANSFVHKDIALLETPYETSPATKEELGKVLAAYLELKEALFRSDVKAADEYAGKMAGAVEEVKADRLADDGRKAWDNHADLYKRKLQEMIHIQGLENKRSYFSQISEIMYCTVKSFGLGNNSIYTFYCPMAFERKGAYWLSKDKEVRNPYFGEKMPDCGELKGEL